MRKMIFFAFLILINSIFITGCATQEGIIFSDYTGPITHSPHEITKTATIAEGSNITILGLFTFGEASGESIARKAGFSKIYRLDYHETSLLGGLIYKKYTVIVTGEATKPLDDGKTRVFDKNGLPVGNSSNPLEADQEIK